MMIRHSDVAIVATSSGTVTVFLTDMLSKLISGVIVAVVSYFVLRIVKKVLHDTED